MIDSLTAATLPPEESLDFEAGFLQINSFQPERAARDEIAMFVQEKIEKLKHEWTDKYVVVDGSRPELRRFDGYTGQVKTVNMSGRALVQFDAWSNIGWYDIELGYLQVVPKPDPAMAGKKAETKAAPKAEAKAADAKPAAAKAGGKMSVAEMLAAARANKPAGAPAAEAAVAEPAATVVEEKKPVATAKPQAAAGGTTLPKGQRPTVAQMIAYCREHDASS